MARNKRKLDLPAGELDMTSMIDCVFLLIIFFMMITDLKKSDIVKLSLPIARSAVEEVDEKIVINIKRNGDLWVAGQKKSVSTLKNYLELKRLLLNADEKEPDGFAKVLVKIRSDQLAEFRDVQKVLKVCADEKFNKTTFGALNYELQ